MAFVGDLVPRSGMYTEPGVIIEKKEDGSVVVDTEPLTINRYHRYSNTSGLTPDEKDKFNHILDDIYRKEDKMVQMTDIQQEIDMLKIEPENKNIVQYLRNQQAMMIRDVRKLPRTYNADEAGLKV
jgi:hypothetical protein